jgi:hypothetical protein
VTKGMEKRKKKMLINLLVTMGEWEKLTYQKSVINFQMPLTAFTLDNCILIPLTNNSKFNKYSSMN